MKKLIIENNTGMHMLDVLPYVQHVIGLGRISETGKGDQFCFYTTFDGGVSVSAFRNAKSDRLVVSKKQQDSV